jgi:hypothetical protein
MYFISEANNLDAFDKKVKRKLRKSGAFDVPLDYFKNE